MGDVFKEQIVIKEPTSKDTLQRVGLVILVILITLASLMFIPGFAMFVVAAAVFGAYYFMSMLKCEYEYIYTNGELDIDVIYNRTRRKRLFSGNVKSFDVCAHVNDKMHENDFRSAAETKDYSSGKVKDNTYAFLATFKGKKIKIIFEPNEVIVQSLAQMMTTRKFFKKL